MLTTSPQNDIGSLANFNMHRTFSTMVRFILSTTPFCSMFGAIFFELLGDVFSTIIGSKLLKRNSYLSLHHGMEFMKMQEYLTFCMQQVNPCLSLGIVNESYKVFVTN